jgi:hypothetical protein
MLFSHDGQRTVQLTFLCIAIHNPLTLANWEQS